jgi:tetratricopeptide (TPR) repeat protein
MLESKSKVVPPVDDPFSEELTELSYSSTRLLKQAGVLAHLGYPERAIEVARRAAQAEPTDPDIHFFLARTLLASHPENPVIVDESLTQLAECIRLRPDDPAPLWMFAQDFFEVPKAGIAMERLRDLVTPYRERTEAHFFLGLLADGRGQTGEAISQYRTALEHEPANAAVYNKLGLALNKAGRLDEAIASFQKSVELNSMNPVARFNLAAARLQRGNEAQGMKDLVEVLRLKPDYAPAHFCMAFACLYAKKPTEAITHFREGLRQMPNDPEAHFGLASVLSMQRKPQDAIVELREALMLRPNYPEATDLLRRLER